MDPSRLQILVTVAYPALFGAVLIMISIVGCRLHTHHHRLTRLEAYVGPHVPIASPVLQSQTQSQSQPSAPPMLDPMPPPPDHYALSMPTVAAVAQMRHYNGYI
jgi:hypothetical protein